MGGGAGDVTLKFTQEGADRTQAAVDKLTDSAKKLDDAWTAAAKSATVLKQAADSVSVAAVQNSAATERSNGTIAKTAEAAGGSVEGLNQRFRVGSRVAIGLASDLSGQLNPTLGKMASSLQAGVAAGLAFGGAIGVVVAAVQLVVQAVTAWIEKSKANEEFQIRLSQALKQQDLGFVAGELQKLTIEMQKFGGQTDENKKKLAELQVVYRAVFAQTEAPKLQREALQAQLALQQKSAQFDVERATTADQVTAGIQKQQAATKALAETQAQAIEQEAQASAKRMRDQGFGKEADQVQASAKAKAEAIRQGAELETQILDKAGKDRIETIRMQGIERQRLEKELGDALLAEVTKIQDRQTQILQAAGNNRLAILGAQHERETATLDLADMTTGKKAQDRAALETRYAQEGLDQRTRMIDDEVAILNKRKDMFKDNADAQRQIDARLLELQTQRVQAEVTADGQIVAARKQMVDQLRAEADREAGLGETLAGKAIAKLKERGKTRITDLDVQQEIDKAQRRGAEAYGGLATGGRVKISDLEEAMGNRGMFADLASMGTTPANALGQATARGRAAFAGERFVPSTFAGAPIPEFQAGLPGMPYAPSGPEAPQLDKLFDDLKTKGNKTIQEMLDKIPNIMQDYFQKFSDELIRKLEAEAARS